MTAVKPRVGSNRGANAYQATSLQSMVHGASREELTLIVLKGAEDHIKRALIYMEKGDIQGKGESISKCIDIVNQGLLGVLDFEAGGEVSQYLSELYENVTDSLIYANRHNSSDHLKYAYTLLNSVTQSWEELVNTRKEQGLLKSV